mgnify:CR=1 FL=1
MNPLNVGLSIENAKINKSSLQTRTSLDDLLSGATYLMAVEIPWDCTGAKSNTMSYSNKTVEIATDIATKYTSDISIFPNPTKGLLTIEGENMNSISITDLTSKVIYEKEVNTNSVELDLSGHSKAVYFVKVETAEGTRVEKLILK